MRTFTLKNAKRPDVTKRLPEPGTDNRARYIFNRGSPLLLRTDSKNDLASWPTLGGMPSLVREGARPLLDPLKK